MKTAAISAVMAIGIGCASAFTLDFVSVGVANTPNDLVVHVAGYGNVSFASTAGSVSTVFDVAADKVAMEMKNSEIVTITFLASPTATITGIEASNLAWLTTAKTAPNAYTFQFLQTTRPETIRAITFVPEPATAMLGALGALLLFRRRRD